MVTYLAYSKIGSSIPSRKTILHVRLHARFIKIKDIFTTEKNHRSSQDFYFSGFFLSSNNDIWISIFFKKEGISNISTWDYWVQCWKKRLHPYQCYIQIHKKFCNSSGIMLKNNFTNSHKTYWMVGFSFTNSMRTCCAGISQPCIFHLVIAEDGNSIYLCYKLRIYLLATSTAMLCKIFFSLTNTCWFLLHNNFFFYSLIYKRWITFTILTVILSVIFVTPEVLLSRSFIKCLH